MTTATPITICPSQRITYSKKYIPEHSKRYARFRNPVEEVVIGTINHKRAFTRVNSQIVKVVKGKSGDDNAK